MLTQHNWRVSYQQPVGYRAACSAPTLNHIHKKCGRRRCSGGRIDAIFVCPHGPDDGCACRKPLPGLFHDIARRYDACLDGVPAVGDSLRDLQAATAAGCAPWLVTTGNGEKTRHSLQLPRGVEVRDNLLAVVRSLLDKEH